MLKSDGSGTKKTVPPFLNFRGGTLSGAKIYVTLFPCNECAKAIVQSGIKTMIYESDKYADQSKFIASRMILKAAGVELIEYHNGGREINFTV